MKYADVGGALGWEWSFTTWQDSLAEAHNLGVPAAAITRRVSGRGADLARVDGPGAGMDDAQKHIFYGTTAAYSIRALFLIGVGQP